MRNNNAEVYTVLSSVGTTSFQYPEEFATWPAISYWDSGHTSQDFNDGKAGIDLIETTVDVWEKEDKSGNLVQIHAQVDSAMRSAKFIRTMFMDLFETDTKIFHYQMKYIKPYEEVD